MTNLLLSGFGLLPKRFGKHFHYTAFFAALTHRFG